MAKDVRSSDVKDLESASSASATDLVPAERNGRDVYLTAQQIADLGGGGGAVSSVDGRTGAVTLSDLYDASGAAATAQSNAIAASQPVDADLTAIAAVATQAFGRNQLANANAAAAISALGLDADLATLSVPASTTISAFGATLVDDANAAASIATLGLDADIATLALPASTTISAFGATIVDDADAPTARATIGADAALVPTAVKTATTYTAAAQDFVPCDTTSNSITITLPTAPADKTLVGVKHVIQAGTNTVTIACAGSDVINKAGGATSATLPNLAESYIFQYKSSGAIWYIVEHDSPRTAQYFESLAALSPASLTALQTQAQLAAAKQDARVIADGGYFCYSAAGCALTPNGTPTKLDMAAGVVFIGTTELVVAAQAAIATTIASLADATNPKWVVVELDTSAVVQFNQGTAAATPAFPTLTTTRVPLGYLFVPANATNVDTLLTTNNGLAKLIDARNVRVARPSRVLFTDSSVTVTTSVSLTSISTTIATSLFNKAVPHGLVANQSIQFSGISTTTGVSNATAYFVSATGLTANAFRVAATAGGTAITLGGTTDSSIVAFSHFASILSSIPSLPANSLSVGDVITIDVSFFSTNNVANSGVGMIAKLNAASVGSFTSTGTLSTSAFARPHSMHSSVVIKAIGAGGTFLMGSRGAFGNILTNTAEAETHGSATGAGTAIDTTAAATLDFQTRYVVASAAATFTTIAFTITKFPAQ